jgi:hypothetical protein
MDVVRTGGDFGPQLNVQRKGSKKVKEFEVLCLPNANKAVLRVLPFTSKWLNGKTYLVTQAEVSLETDLGTPRKGVGLIFDKENGREYALTIDDFNRFMETGDVSLLPRELKPSLRKRTLQLKELNSRAHG